MSNTFLFGDGKPGVTSFCFVAARRFAILFPLAGIVSETAIDATTIILLLLWLLSGGWLWRVRTYTREPVMLALSVFLLWTVIIVVRFICDDTSLAFEAVHHWWSRYPFILLLILSTFYIDKKTRATAFSFFAIGMIILYLNMVLVRGELVAPGFPRCYILFDTITSGCSLAMWCVFWIFLPYTSRDIPLVRRVLPVSVLLGMKIASRTSPLDFFWSIIPFAKTGRIPFFGIVFTIIRWSIIAAIICFLFKYNPSRQAQFALLLAIISGLLVWNWRKGIVYFIILLIIVAPLAVTNDAFVAKWQRTYNDIGELVSKEVDDITHKDRHYILVKSIDAISEKPLMGHGLDIDLACSLTKTGFVHTHCDFTQIAIQFGLIGMVLLVIFLITLFFYAVKIPPPINQFAIAALTVLVVCMSFDAALYIDKHKYVMFFAIAVVIGEIIAQRQRIRKAQNRHQR
ncbi:MAG: O-antigen ligase family protein [Planctomycetaceae bacterium]|jgi:hypothetical protein|nr:O-antigen ligase family protein [Planctomycetaceae bacterium]